MTASSILWTLAAAGVVVPMGAQSLKEALSLVPRSAESVEIYRDASTLDIRVSAGIAPVAPVPPSGLQTVDAYKHLGLAPEAQAPGSVLHCTFPALPKGAKGSRSADWIPVADFAAFVRTVKAVKVGGAYKVKRDGGTYFLAKSGHFALVTENAALLREIQAKTPRLGTEMTPLLPWLGSHDLVMLFTPSKAQASFKKLRTSLDKDAGSQALKPILGPLVDAVAESVTHAGIALDFPGDHSIRFHARAFFRAGSPLAKAGAGLSRVPGHPLEGISPSSLVFGAGGPLPRALGPWAERLTLSALSGLDAAQAAKVAPIQAAMCRNVQSEAFALGLPAAGAPLLGNVRWRIGVEDPSAYLDSTWAMKEFQGPVLSKLGLHVEMKRDVLPGVPSFTQVFTLGEDAAKAVTPQIQLLLGILLGSQSQVSFSVGQLDPHTLVGVLGDAQSLKAALAETVPGFAGDPAVAAADALLPAGAPWRFYLSVHNGVAFAKAALNASMPAQAKALPQIPPAPPLGFAVDVDAGGAELTGAATPETLAAIGSLVKGFATSRAQTETPAPYPESQILAPDAPEEDADDDAE